ncbi:MAG TPA: YhjD/YihY/BrkB family envelope integrity protein [Aeromicrobium sp.]|nr:YhjD/YihY/BrkB family envelope integrity protein [Aeromicrobium sp.]
MRALRSLLDQPIRAYRHYTARNGSTLAAAVTYFAFLSLFPLLALSLAAVGFVADSLPGAQRVMDAVLQALLPGMVGDDPDQISLAGIREAAGAAAGIGVLTMLYAGIGWISEMRDALAATFDVESSRGPALGRQKVVAFLATRARDAVALMAIGLILLVSVGVSGGLLGLLSHIGGVIGVDDDLGFVTPALLVAAGVATGTVLFFAMFKLLAAPTLASRALWSGALVGAVGFELLKQASTLLLGMTAQQPAFQAFGIALILLVWIYYFSRVLLFAASWAAAGPKGTK